ncbi:unnamed protein product [Chilo suppressalis]|uniref:Sodium/potassium-transporting ATPase subunit beta n=1 Tax=Chilo suppressalis TaxID=168631 RepID=A0ABN8AWI7_CHISP|nr:unnamed protein product [Chilo suppressalis]
MAPKRDKSGNVKKRGLNMGNKAATVPTHAPKPSTSKEPAQDAESGRRKCFQYIYNKESKTCLGRTGKSWLYIVSYSIMYLIFLCTYTLIFLFGTLIVFKHTDYSFVDKTALFTYSEHGIGLTATPTSEFSYPLISYKIGDDKDYQKYVSAIDRLLVSRRNVSNDYSYLGPCSQAPYGYGRTPCVIIKINHQLRWAGKPIQKNSTQATKAPKEVRDWLRSSEMLWLHCDGYHSYDKEHIGTIKYFPHPPGFDPSLFPLDVRNQAPLVAIQISGFSQGMSVAIQCNLWYEDGPSSVEFVLYVDPQVSLRNSTHSNSMK